MGRFQFLNCVLISALLFTISLPQGYGRGIKALRHYDTADHSTQKRWVGREMAEMVMDYKEPGANTNPRSGILPPPPTHP